MHCSCTSDRFQLHDSSQSSAVEFIGSGWWAGRRRFPSAVDFDRVCRPVLRVYLKSPMSPAEISQAIQDTQFFTAMRESRLVYPAVLATHLTSIAIFGGFILMTDLRLLGIAMKNVPISEIVRQTRLWKRVGFLIMITCGVLLAGSKLASYYDNPYFQIKMSLLA